MVTVTGHCHWDTLERVKGKILLEKVKGKILLEKVNGMIL